MNDRSGERFGRYEILAELGRGSMGIVYKARDPKINRIVAVKTVSLEGQLPEEKLEYRERFFREAEAAGRLSHPNIVTIFDVGEEPDTHIPYIVMEFVGGQSLEKLLSDNRHRMPLQTALRLALELAEALDCAHGQGVVHRDLKPANILLTEDGRAKIADFGVAKLNQANHTLAGHVLGTPAYMSPEQLNGDAVDGRSDVFSLGVILYTVLTGYRPFQGTSALTVSLKVVSHEPVRASVLDSDLPHGLDYIIARAMAKDPSQRYQQAREMARDIQEMCDGREPGSKAQQADWSQASEATATANARARWAASRPAMERQSGLGRGRGHFLRAVGQKALRQMPANFFLTAALIAATCLIFGIGLSYVVKPQAAPPGVSRKENPDPTIPVNTPIALGTTTPASANSDADQPVPAPEKAVAQAHPAAPIKVAKKTVSIAPRVAAVPSTASTMVPAAGVSSATLEIDVGHNFKAAHLSIWVDGHPMYTQLLEGNDKKRLIVFHNVHGHESQAIQVVPGKHSVRVQVVSDGNSNDQSASVTGEFPSKSDSVLKVRFNKQGEMNLSLQ